MPTENPLPQLRRLRNEIARIDALVERRNALIHRAAELDYSERQIAEAAGISHGRVHQILHSR